MLGISEKIQRATNAMQKRLHDNWINITGSGASTTFLITMKADRYNNKAYVLEDYKPFTVRVEFPGQEIPVATMGNNNNITSNNVLHMYEILPIVAFCRFEDNVNTGDIFLYKVKLGNGEFQTLVFQFLQPTAKANRVSVIYQEWVVAPVTDYAIINNPAFQSVLEEYKSQDNW
jgi:hypothetical protein